MAAEPKSAARRAIINPAILKWARESSLLDIEAAAKYAHVSDPQKFAAAEKGDGYISFRQLEAFAHSCRLPLRVFYQKSPPKELRLPVDFRSDAEGHGHFTTELVKVLRSARERQLAAVDLLAELEVERPPLPKASSDKEILEVLTPLVCAKAWSNEIFRATADSNSTKALTYTKSLLEERLPLLIFEFPGELSHVRGCSLYDEKLSVILLSSVDSPNARRFTLVHELVHLLLRQSGLCSPISGLLSEEIERRCNLLAGGALMPQTFVKEVVSQAGSDIDRQVETVASRFRVSHSAAAVRLSQLDEISASDLRKRLDFYSKQWAKKREKQSEGDGGPNFHLLQVQRLGGTFTNAVLTGMERDLISLTQGADLLGVAPSFKSFDGIREKLLTGQGG